MTTPHRRDGGYTGMAGLAATLITVGLVLCGAAFFEEFGDALPTRADPPALEASTPLVDRAGQWERPAAAEPAQPLWIRIPAIEVSAPITPRGLRPDGTLEVPPQDRAGVTGWYRNGPAPGDPGPSVIAGHVDSKTSPGVFYRLGELQPGDAVQIARSDGRTVTFRVGEIQHVAKDAFPTGRVYGQVGLPVLRLITCGGSFDSDLHAYTENVIAYASLAG